MTVVKLTPTQRKIFDAISRQQGLATRDADKFCSDVYALKVHVVALRKKGIPVVSVHQPNAVNSRGGRGPVTYFLNKHVECPQVWS